MKLAERCNSVEKIKALSSWQHSTLFDEQERAVLSYTEAMTITGQRVTDDMLSTLKQWFDEDAIVDLTALIAFQNLSAKFNTALDVPKQNFCSLPIQPGEQQAADAPKQTDK